MSLEHRAFLYRGTDDFLSATVPFLTSGLERDQAVLAVVREPNLSALRDVFPATDPPIQFIDAAGFYRHPVHTLRDYQTVVTASAPRRVCAVAEPIWEGLDERRTREWIRYESLINAVFEHSGARALCTYDTRTLPPPILTGARRTHPLLLDGGRAHSSDHYVDPVTFGADCDRARSPERPDTAEHLPVDGDDLHPLRAFVGERAHKHGLTGQQTQNLVTAANEVAANALRHGTPPVGMWMWQSGDDLVCEIGDRGRWCPGPSPLTGYIPPDTALQRGFGLWTVRLLVDLVELRADWNATSVRLYSRI
ncbi:anti-sigma regulatory factor (Ser/Thr protein kinase) [Actinomadura pelletieri DSM 43383]|uniref:Anti-sigma regulatory factor (Ser/Thr protein kinase) n=1 Tax=Actinomadura pelletieri DSM 43383 TaxID=1120940 RepID=A0A495QTG3_9ACTN|nr:sensor histidine kinase [Actinomadura pelletieri]RKS76814.1 anti-sigma regulatory factor (Ser/Thr protein kinase) [Actinomadura pelletieri DSM 43383]